MLRRNILFTDGADHLRLRGSVRDIFTRPFIAGLRDGIATIAADTIDCLPAGVEFDFMTDIALPLPIAVAAAWDGTRHRRRPTAPRGVPGNRSDAHRLR